MVHFPRIIRYVLFILFIALGIFTGIKITDNQFITGGILGLAVLFLMVRSYAMPGKKYTPIIGKMSGNFTGLLLTYLIFVVFSLAVYGFAEMIFWIIKSL